MSEENKKIRMVPAVCTQCGAKLDVDPSQDAAVCPYCGTPFLVEKAINQYSIQYNQIDVHNNIRIQHGKRGVVESTLDFINTQQKQQKDYQLEQERLAFEKEKYANERRAKRNKTILSYIGWFLGFVYIFPVPVMLILKKKENMSEDLKKKIIIGCWAVYLLIIGSGLLFGDRSSSSDTPKQTPVPAETQTAVSDFDPNTNQKVTVGSYTVQIPSTWQLKEKSASNTNGSIAYFDPSYSTDDYEKIKNDPSILLNAMTKDYFKVNSSHSDTVTRGGFEDTAVTWRGISKEGQKELEVHVHIMRHTSSDACLGLALTQYAENGPDYRNDFEKIISSVSWSAPAPTVAPQSGMRPEFKEQMDSYEAFMDEYISFMKTFDAENTTAEYLKKYMDFLTKYNDYVQKVDSVDESTLSDEEEKYYVEVTTRVSRKLMEAAIEMN